MWHRDTEGTVIGRENGRTLGATLTGRQKYFVLREDVIGPGEHAQGEQIS